MVPQLLDCGYTSVPMHTCVTVCFAQRDVAQSQLSVRLVIARCIIMLEAFTWQLTSVGVYCLLIQTLF